MKKLSLILISLTISMLGYAQDFNLNGITYGITSSNTVTAKGYTISNPNLVIPKTISHPTTNSKYSVTSIANLAFNAKGLTSVSLPSGLLTIGFSSFSNNSITSVVIPSTVTSIDYRAFEKNQITTLDLGTGVSDMGLAAFQLNKITSLVLPSSVQTMGNGVFQDNLIKNITVKIGVGNIGVNAFLNNPILSVTCEGLVPSSLESSAFTSRNTIDLYIPSGTKAAYVTNSGALWTGFKSVAEANFVINYITYEITSTNPNTAMAINYNILGGSSVNIPASITISGLTYSVTEIGEDAFKQKGLTSLTLSEGLIEIGSRAFNSNNLTSLAIPNSVKTIQYNVFNYNQLTTLDLGTGIEVIANGSFGYNKLTSVVIPSSMIAMGGGVFFDNDITMVTVRAGVGQLGFRTFWENPLTTVISESTTPPTITTGGQDETFAADRSNIDLIIPSGTLGAYVTNSGALWTGFKSVSQNPVLNVSSSEFSDEIYLNQTPNEIQIVSKNTELLNGYMIYNIDGFKIIEKSTSESKINISGLSNGYYILKLNFKNGVVTEKFIK